MTAIKVFVLVVLCVCLVVPVVIAKGHTPEERGKALFEDDYFAAGEKACSSCHPGGRGLEKAGARADLEDMVNKCIVNANKGQAIDVNSDKMKDITAYIKSLAK